MSAVSAAVAAGAAAEGERNREEPGLRANGRAKIVVVRSALIALGVAGTLAGFWLLFTTVRPQQLLGLAVWLGAALVLHDGALSGIVWLLTRLLKSVPKRVPRRVIAVVQVGTIVGFVLSLLAVPELAAKAKGPQISTLPLNYGLNFALIWAGIGALTLALAVGLLLRSHAAAKPAESTPALSAEQQSPAQQSAPPAQPTLSKPSWKFKPKLITLAVASALTLGALGIALLRRTKR